MSKWVGKWKHAYNRMLLSSKYEKMIDVCNNFDKSQIHYGQLKKPVVKGYVLDTYWSPDFHEDQSNINVDC